MFYGNGQITGMVINSYKMLKHLFDTCLIIGWQTRWFVLENGILTYYKSQEEVNQGCKGSLKVQACEINGNLLYFFFISLFYLFLMHS